MKKVKAKKVNLEMMMVYEMKYSKRVVVLFMMME